MTGTDWKKREAKTFQQDPEDRAALFGLDRLPRREIPAGIFLEQWAPRFGAANPERVENALWLEQMRSFELPFRHRERLFGDGCPQGLDPDPLPEAVRRARARLPGTFGLPSLCPGWSFERFGRSITELPDGRLVLIGGEHEDFFDDDFCIYADVTVIARGEGAPRVEHFLYPAEDFPPTHGHSATLLDGAIWLIGGRGYRHEPRFGETQVLRLDLADFSVRPVEIPGPRPGWICNHHAVPQRDGGSSSMAAICCAPTRPRPGSTRPGPSTPSPCGGSGSASPRAAPSPRPPARRRARRRSPEFSQAPAGGGPAGPRRAGRARARSGRRRR